MEFLYGTAFLSAVARGLRAADHGRDARRRDAVHAQRRGRGAVARSSTRSSSAGRRSTSPLPQYAAGTPGRRRPTRCSARAALAGDLMARRGATASGPRRTRRPAAIEAALRELLRAAHAEDDTFAPARVLNLVVVVDREWRGEIRTGSSASAATTRRARSSARSSRAARRSTRRGDHDAGPTTEPGELAPDARADRARRGAASTSRSSTRSSTRSWSRTSRRCSGRRTAITTRSTRCCTCPRSC